MEKIKLVRPTKKDEKRVLDFKQECLSDGEKEIHGDGGLDNIDSYDEWLKKLKDGSKIETCSSDFVPATTYIAIRESDNKVIGTL